MGKKVFLSAGHGGKDPGAVGNGLKEKDINLQILKACKSELERHGVEVVASRLKDEDDPVGQEVKEANASKADIAVSFHTNAGGGDGSEAYYYSKDSKSKKLAELGEKYVKALNQNSRGVKSGDKLYFVRNTKMTAVLFECAFIDNKTDVKIIDTVADQKAFGVAYAKAILEYFGIKYQEETKAESNTNTSVKTNNIPRVPFKVRVSISDLNIRDGASSDFISRGHIPPNVYTIKEVRKGKGSVKGWGRLKSGAGWISLDYVTIL